MCLGEARRSGGNGEESPSTPAAAAAGASRAEVANASNCGHFIMISWLVSPTATGGGVTFGPCQSLGGSHPLLPQAQWSELRPGHHPPPPAMYQPANPDNCWCTRIIVGGLTMHDLFFRKLARL